MTRAVLTALTTCLFAAFFEAVYAGRGVRGRVATVQTPSYSIPFGAWICGYLFAGFFSTVFVSLTLFTGRQSAHMLMLELQCASEELNRKGGESPNMPNP